MIPSLPRPVLERLAQSIIDRLDDMDGDADVEPNGDEQDHSQSEDDSDPARYLGMDLGPGCSVADNGEGSKSGVPARVGGKLLYNDVTGDSIRIIQSRHQD